MSVPGFIGDNYLERESQVLWGGVVAILDNALVDCCSYRISTGICDRDVQGLKQPALERCLQSCDGDSDQRMSLWVRLPDRRYPAMQ
jgi:hypothetical protein